MASFDQRELRNVLGSFVTGVTVITTVGEDGVPRGVTVNSFSSVSLDPPLVLWSQALTASTHPVFRDAPRFVVNILSEEQVEVSRRFSNSKIENRFEGVSHQKGLGGVPILDGCAAFLECRRFATYPGGDHAVFLGEVENFQRLPKKPLAFHGGRYMVAYAHEPGAVSPEAGAERLEQLKAVRLAIAALPEIRTRIGMGVFIAVWGNRGPTIVHWEPMPGQGNESLRLGAVLSTVTTATGLVFAAFLPRTETQGIIDEERSAALGAGLPAPRQEQIENRLSETRLHGMARQTAQQRPDYGDPHRLTLSAPVFDHSGRIVLAVTLFGQTPEGGADWDAPAFKTLLECTATLSRQLGHKPTPTA